MPTHATPGSDWRRQVFPVLMEKSPHLDLRKDSLVTTGFLTGFQVGYIIKEEERVLPLTKVQLPAIRATAEAVHKAAMANLTRDTAGATFKFFDSPDGGVLLFESEGGLHASRMLLPNLYPWLNKYMGGPFVVGVPNRDVLIAVAESNQTALSGLPDDLAASYNSRRFPLTLKTFRVPPRPIR